MRYWWVNQNQTYRHEVQGGYLWSPKRESLRPLLPERYSPLQPNGNGLQPVYLTEVPAPLAEVLIGLIGEEIAPIAVAARNVNVRRPARNRRQGASGD